MSTRDNSDDELIQQQTNKKQKLDDRDDNSVGNNSVKDEIDITNLPKQTVVQLKDIASSLGISIKSGTKKNDIIEQIKAVYKRKQDTLVKIEIDSNINSFNKGIIEFKIKDGIDPLEWLFWRIFRNKFIYKRIMSFMDKNLSIEYDLIVSVTKMLKYGKSSMLRDKVVRNQNISLNDKHEINQIFSTFKNSNDQDRLFYKQFFKHYGKFILKFNAILNEDEQIEFDWGNDREGLVNQLIEVKCLPALQILVQEYQYQPTELNLQHAINQGKLKFIKFILQQQPKLKDNIQQLLSNNIKTTTTTTTKIKTETNNVLLFKSLNWLNNEKIIDINLKSNTILLQYIQSNKYKINETISLKLLIIICKLIWNNVSINNKNNNNNNINQEEIESFLNSLTKQELSLPLSDVSFQIQNKKETILKLLDLYYRYGNSTTDDIERITHDHFYYLYFKYNGTDYGQGDENEIIHDFNIDKSNLTTHIKQSFQFANFSLLKHCMEFSGRNNYNRSIGEINIKLNSSFKSFIFTHCNGEENKEKRIKFINSLFGLDKEKETQVNKYIKTSNYIKSESLLHLLIGYDEIEMVKHFSTILDDEDLKYDPFESRLNAFIKSKEMLEYLYNNHYFKLDRGIWNFKDIQLLKHYESLVTSGGGIKNKFILLPYFQNSPNDPSLELLKYVIEKGPTIYKFLSISKIYRDINYYYPIGNDKFELMKSLFINYQLNNNDVDNDDYGESLCNNFSKVGLFGFFGNNSSGLVKFIDWLFINHPNSLICDDIYERDFQDGIEIVYYYLTGRFNQLNDIVSIIDILEYGFEIKNTKSLDFICNNIKKSILTTYIGRDEGSMLLLAKHTLRMFESLTFNCQLKMFEHIQNNHSWLFKSRSTKSNYNNELPLFTSKDLKSILFKSLKDECLVISEFLFEFLSCTKKEFKDNSTNISKYYFKNKQFK